MRGHGVPRAALPRHDREPQLPPHQPHPAAWRSRRFMGWFSKLEQPAAWRAPRSPLWRAFADLRLRRSEEGALHQPARLLHARAEGRRAPGRRRPGGAGEPLRRDRRRVRPRSRARAVFQAKGFALHAARICCTTQTSSRRSATAPTPRCASPRACTTASTRRTTCASSAGHLLLRRRLEREPAGAEARGEALLQERARGDPHAARSERPRAAAGAGGRGPGGEHPPALRRRAPAPALPRAERDRLRRARSPRARRWAGSSTARPSWCSRRAASACSPPKAAVIRAGQPLMRLPRSRAAGRMRERDADPHADREVRREPERVRHHSAQSRSTRAARQHAAQPLGGEDERVAAPRASARRTSARRRPP